jgi:transposase
MADWLLEDHLAWFVLDAVEEMDLSAVYASCRVDGWGGAAHDPATMVALLCYAYCVGVRSSRRIERACHVDVAFRVICAGLLPDRTTVAWFRQRHGEALKTIFTASFRLCAKAGMAGVGRVALDGTKMAAASSMQANATKDVVDDAVEKMFAEAKAVDEAEDATFEEARGDEPPAALRGCEDRRRCFKAAKEILDLDAERSAHEDRLAERAGEEQRQGRKLRGRKPKAPGEKSGYKDKKVNTTDPESKVMSTKNGFLQGYNAQAVANEDQVIVCAEVTDEQNDKAQLHPMIDATNESLEKAGIGDRPATLLADAGYASEENFAALDEDDPDSYVAVRNMKKNPTRRTGRRGPLKKDATLVDKMDRKVSNKNGRALYRRRQAIIEPVFGQIKGARQIRSFMRRGKQAADSEWKLICGTHNLLKIYRRALAKPGTVPFSRLAVSLAG